jgi:hypothetical protein
VYATSRGLPPPPWADVSGPPAGTSTVFPAMAIDDITLVKAETKAENLYIERTVRSRPPRHSDVDRI